MQTASDSNNSSPTFGKCKLKLINILLWALYTLSYTAIIWYDFVPYNYRVVNEFEFYFWTQAVEITLIITAILRNLLCKKTKNIRMAEIFFFAYLFKIIVMPWYMLYFIFGLLPDSWTPNLIPDRWN